MSFNRRQNVFSISDMQNPAARHAVEKANSFSGIAHYQPPGGKSSIDFANGTGSTTHQHNPWQTSSRAANASTDLSYQLQLSRAGGTPPTAGRRTASPSQPGTPMLGQGASALNAQQFSPTPRSGSNGGSYPAAYGDSSSKGAFGGKTIVQPPGGRTSFNIFGGA
ncbi:hypothetical protein OEZ85_006685 [Tetradesmus obliquus]|uniref:Uncharacterized protein n=1 Tax=Tetradesmus obliquus TaxID=3088 RepID=A0ABY8TVU3_TETOB|nr:hypothetical protein OEZ85_006685 [Tetradesmus obliquus]